MYVTAQVASNDVKAFYYSNYYSITAFYYSNCPQLKDIIKYIFNFFY